MAKTVSLPFEVPVFASTQGSAASGVAMSGHPTAYNQNLNQATSLICSRQFIKGYTSPKVAIFNIGIGSYKFFDRYTVNCRFVREYFMDIIKQMLDEGFYVIYSHADDFYLPDKSWYGIRHMHHDGIICGYDENDCSVSIAAYDINWIFRLIRVPEDCFVRAIESSLDEKIYGNITAYKIKDNTVVEINEAEMLKNLKEYIDSDLNKYPPEIDSAAKGTVVHDYIAMYLDKLKDGSIPFEKMDWRALRPVWEHKKCMLDRIKAIESKHGLSDSLSKKYAPVVVNANRLRMMYAVYHRNHNDRLLDKIRDGLLDVKNADNETVKVFINTLEELVK